MSKFVTLPVIPAPIPEGNFSHAADMNMGQSMRRVSGAFNYVSANQRKQVLSYCASSTPTPASADVVHHYFVFRTGENVRSVDALLGMRSASPGNTSSAYCEMVLYDGTNTLTSEKVYYPTVGLLIDDLRWMRVSLTTADGLLPNTAYSGWIRQYNFVRLKSASVFETGSGVTDSTVAGVSDPLNWETHRPITDAAVQDIAEAGDKLWKHNGLHLFGWPRRTEATAPSITSTSYVNVFQNATTAWSATAPGFMLNTLYHNTSNGDVPVELGIRATRTAGAGTLDVQLVQNGATVLTKTGITSPASVPFNSSAHTILAHAPTKTDILVRVSSGTWRIDAIGLWEYEA